MPVVDIFKSDFATHPSPIAEFPVTTMSTDLANAIAAAPRIFDTEFASGLDVGTGSGLHAAAMASAGVRDILAIDISADAIAMAKDRFCRIQPQLENDAGRSITSPRYSVQDMANLPLDPQFDLIVANPPSFFPVQDSTIPDVPMTHALFDGERASATKPECSFMYRLFDHVVRHSLMQNGIVLCTWPAIEKRVADNGDGQLVHPAQRLEEWFGWQVIAEDPNAESFFSRTAAVSGYGRDDQLLEQVAADPHFKTIYSRALTFPAPLTMTFRYGILALRRDTMGSQIFVALDYLA